MKAANKTHTPKKDDSVWHLIDAQDKVLGRLASEIATILIGKDKADFSYHVQMGDKVVVINASKYKTTGNKLDQKIYIRHTGFPGAVKEESLRHLSERLPNEAIRRAVKGMLPKNKLQKQRMANLYIYEGAEHPHKANIK